jgi:hypothetical protein
MKNKLAQPRAAATSGRGRQRIVALIAIATLPRW